MRKKAYLVAKMALFRIASTTHYHHELSQLHPRLPYSQNPKDHPEDVTICSMAVLATGRKPHLHLDLRLPQHSSLVGAFDVLSHDNAEKYEKAVNATKTALIVTVGNTGIAGLPRAYRVKFMADILTANKELNQTQPP